MPEKPCIGWPLNGSAEPSVGAEVRRASVLPVNLPDTFMAAGASAGAGISVWAGSTAWPVSVALYSSCAAA